MHEVVREEIRSYDQENPPPNLDAALTRMFELTQAVSVINADLSDALTVINDASIPRSDQRKVDKIAWRARALRAKGHKEREHGFLKNWVRHQRATAQRLIHEAVVDPTDAKSILAGCYRMLMKFQSEGGELEPDELELRDIIKSYIGLS